MIMPLFPQITTLQEYVKLRIGINWLDSVLGVLIYMQCAMYTYLLYLSNKDPESENKILMT